MTSILQADARERLLGRLRLLSPDSRPLWGRMSAPQMIAHLADQMRLTLGEIPAAPRAGPLRWQPMKFIVLNWLPWPKGRVVGPPEVFVTAPAEWITDLHTLEAAVHRFVEQPERSCPDHPIFGAMSRQTWGRFCHKHFDHHLRQFGV